MKKIAIVLVSGVLLSGCYAHVCPTYTINPEKKEIHKAEQVKVEKNKQEKSA